MGDLSLGVGAHRPPLGDGAPLDVVVVGSGVAGLSVAMAAAAREPGLRVGILTKAALADATTRWAQGGVAAVLPGAAADLVGRDSTELHLADTVAAGAGLCDDDAVEVLVSEGPGRVQELIALGTVFDRQPGGQLALALEGGHSTARVVHAGGAATGAEVERALVEAVRGTPSAVLEGWLALDLSVAGGRCAGVSALDPGGRLRRVAATHVVLATGGAGQLFSVTTNPAEATGDGVAMALRAGAAVADLEFVQFHPTALHPDGTGSGDRSMPRLLLSESLRGHGAVLRDVEGRRFLDELAPRDVVSRAIVERMAAQGASHLWLDATGLARFAERFPTIAGALHGVGLDPATDWLPVAPAAHYLSGGVLTDLDGASSLPGLWACGEAACTGVHGANRLASNSLLEGLVFGARVVEAIAAGRSGPLPTGAMRALLGADGADAVGGSSVTAGPREAPGGMSRVPAVPVSPDTDDLRSSLQGAMTALAGVVRDAESLAGAAEVVERVRGSLAPPGGDRSAWELVNLVDVAGALLASAAARTETRGSHTRSDFPEADPALVVRLVHGCPSTSLVCRN